MAGFLLKKGGAPSIPPSHSPLAPALILLIIDDLAKATRTMVSIVGASGRALMFGRAPLAPTLQGAQKLRREAHLQVRRNDSPR